MASEEQSTSPSVETGNPTPREVEDAKKVEVFKTALYLTMIDFFKPLFEQLKESHGSLKTMEYLEGVWARLQAFFNKYPSIWDMSWDDIYELAVSGRDEVLTFFRSGTSALTTVFSLWYQAHLSVRESLDDIERLHEYILPPKEGEELPYPKESRKTSSIRWQCYYMNINLAYRLFLHLCSFSSHVLAFFSESSSIGVGTVGIEELKEALESCEKAEESSEGTEMTTVDTGKSAPKDVQL